MSVPGERPGATAANDGRRVDALLERQRALAELSLVALSESDPAPVLQRAARVIRESLQTELAGLIELAGLTELAPGGEALRLAAGTGGFEPADAEFLQAVVNVVSAALQRQRAQARVQESEAWLQAFTAHSPAVMFLKDREGRYRFVNEPFLRRLGFAREAVIGRGDEEIFPREQALAVIANDAQALANGVPLQFEETVRYVEGERVNVVTKFPVYDGTGAIVGVGGIATDITERKRAEQQLREQQALLAEAQKLSGLGCWEWDPKTGRVIWSEELYRIYGLDPGSAEPSFERYLACVHPQDRQHSGAMVARALMDNRGFTYEERVVRPSGEVRHLRSHGEVLRDEHGKPLKMLGACFDVTEQKSAEAALRSAAEDLQALTRRLVEAEEAERRRIARELHDQVGQSLSALNINLDIVTAELRSLLPEGRRESLCRRLEDSLALVDGTLQSIETVMAELRPPLLDEYGLGAALGWYADRFAARTGVRVEVRVEGPGPEELDGQASAALFRIAQEALNNVAKHAAANSVVLSLKEESNQIVLRISDDGVGFDAPARPQGRWGMTTMRERAQAAGGRLEVESARGRGTTVTAAVPAVSAGAAAPAAGAR